MLRLLPPIVLRYLARHKLIALFDVLSVAIGVAVYLAIQTANHSANRAFRSTIDLVAGKSHLEVRGSSGWIEDDVLETVSKHPDVRAATPLLEGYATLPDAPGRYLHIVGSDPFTNGEFETVGALARAGDQFNLEDWLSRPRFVFIHSDLAGRLGAKAGETINAEIDATLVELTVGGILPEGVGSESMAVMDIGWAQELFGNSDRLTSIQLLLRDPQQIGTTRKEIASQLSDGVIVQAPEQRSEQVQRMLEGFQLNITALSMVSILVGVFLIYNSVSASVVRRRREIGILRSTGASRLQVRFMFLAEGLLLGIPGVILGVPLGTWLASMLIADVSQTISSHYVLISASEITIASRDVIVATAYGIGATLLGAWLPALEASRVPPLSALRPNRAMEPQRLPALRLLLIGGLALVLAVAFSLQALTTGPPWVSFAACFCLALGASLATPWLCRLMATFVSRINPGNGYIGLLARIASDNLGRSLHRSAVTVAALMMAVSMTIGVTVMVSSFRNTIDVWINQAMKADLYVTAASSQVLGFKAFLPHEVVEFMEDQPSVESVETYRQTELSLPDGTSFVLGAVENAARDTLIFLGGDGERKIEQFFQPGSALATEALALRLDLKEGSKIRIPTPAGFQEFTIAGVYYDYSDDRGKLVLNRAEFAKYWEDDRIHSFAAFLKDPEQAEAVAEALRVRFSGEGELTIYRNQGIRDRIFEVFDQTFAVTYVLRSIAILVAIFGVSLSLATLVMERTREIGIFRAIGASQGQIRAVYLIEAGLLGLFGSLIGILSGLGMAVILTLVVNKAFFGWTIQLQIPWGDVLLTPLWLVPVAVLAGLIPAARAARIAVSEAVRGE